MTFEEEHYYMLESPPGFNHFFRADDVENWSTCVPLAGGEIVVCDQFVHREGGSGRGTYAKLRHWRGDRVVVLYLRVSANHAGAGTWRELGPLEVLAMAASPLSV